MKRAKKNAAVDPERHSRECSVCLHPSREEIEREFCEWKPAATISRERKITRQALYKHVRAVGLFEKRDRNIKAALGRFIERGYRVRVTASAFIAAITAYTKINAEGEWVDKQENVNATRNLALFDRMTNGELLKYAETGQLPEWWNPNVIH